MRALLPLTFVIVLVCTLVGRADVDTKKAPAKDAGAAAAVETIKDIAYYDGKDADPVRHKLDLYLPKGKKDFPVLMFVHGGTWRSGKKDLYNALGEVFARNGVGTVIVNYRLSPAVQHPAHIQDVARAFAWTVRNIGKYGGRADQVFVSGHSAGGHLVALLGTADNYLTAEKVSPDKIKGVIAISGVYRVGGSGRLKDAFGSDPAVHTEASPLKHVKGNHPPFLIVYADKDFTGLDGMAESMGKSLKDAKCNVKVMKIDDRDHYTIIRSMVKETDPVTQAALKFIAETCSAKPKTAEQAVTK